MIAFLTSWKTWLGILLPIGGAATLLVPGVALVAGQFLSTRGGRIAAAVAIAIWLLWMAFAWVEANSYRRGADDVIQKIEKQDQKAIDAARKARISVSDCYAANGEWSVEDGTCVLP
jgi:hypothetical protein